MAISDALLPEFDHEMAGLRRTLERVPAARLDYRPHPKSATMSELANHLAGVAGWVGGTMGGTELDFASPEVRAMFPPTQATVEGLLDIFDRGVAEARAALAAASDADFMVIWSGKMNGETLFAMPRVAVVRSFVLNHAIHHRAQLGVYLRLLDVPVPALYGPSADEN